MAQIPRARRSLTSPSFNRWSNACVRSHENALMRRIRRREFLAEAGALSVTVSAASTCPPAAAAAGTSDVDPLLAPWTGPHGGLPPFDKVRVEAFGPALRAGMEIH